MKSKKDNIVTTNDLIANWYNKIRGNTSFTEADAQELKNHLYDLMAELQERGLNEEESFIIASRRIGEISEIEDDYLYENFDVVQIRRSAVILAGVLVYFLSYHLVSSLTKLLFIILIKFNVGGQQALDWLKGSLGIMHLLYILLFASILLSERKVIDYIERIKFRPKHALMVLLLTLFFGIANYSLMAGAKSVIGDDPGLRGWFIKYFVYFEYSFPLLFCLGFIMIYFKYYRKAKI